MKMVLDNDMGDNRTWRSTAGSSQVAVDILLAHFPEPDWAWKWGLMGLACPLSAALKVFFLGHLRRKDQRTWGNAHQTS